MLIFPAIDIISGQAVRLLRGDYDKKTVYGNEPESVALDFARAGAGYVHVVDLDGAKEGGTPNFERVVGIKRTSGLFVEIGGGVRDMRTGYNIYCRENQHTAPAFISQKARSMASPTLPLFSG